MKQAPRKRRAGKTGLPPDSLVHIGERKAETGRITLVEYDERRVRERQLPDIAELGSLASAPTVTWLSIGGLHEPSILEEVADAPSSAPGVSIDCRSSPIALAAARVLPDRSWSRSDLKGQDHQQNAVQYGVSPDEEDHL